MKEYKIVITIELPSGEEFFVIWEPELYGNLLRQGVNVGEMLQNMCINDFKVVPVNYLLELWVNPHIKNIVSKIGSNEFTRQVCVGSRLFPIISY